MTPEVWKSIYNVALYVLAGSGFGMIAIMLYRKQYKWGFFFTGVYVSVLIYEGQGYFENGATISNQYGAWIRSDPFWALSALALMLAWMLALVTHLFAAGFNKKK